MSRVSGCVPSTQCKAVITKINEQCENRVYAHLWTQLGEAVMRYYPKEKATGKNCVLGQWVMVKIENRSRNRSDALVIHYIGDELNGIERGKFDEDGDFVVQKPMVLKKFQCSDDLKTRYYLDSPVLGWVQVDYKFWCLNEDVLVHVILKKLRQPVKVPELADKSYWAVKGFYIPEDDVGFGREVTPESLVPEKPVPSVEEKLAFFRNEANASASIPEHFLLEDKKPIRPRVLTAPPPIKYKTVPKPFQPISLNLTTDPLSDDFEEPICLKNATRAIVIRVVPDYMIVFLPEIKKPAVFYLQNPGSAKFSPGMEFSCTHKSIGTEEDKMNLGIEYEVTIIVNILNRTIPITELDNEVYLLLPINLYKNRDQFKEASELEHNIVVESHEFTDFVVMGKEVYDTESGEILLSRKVLKMYYSDPSAARMRGYCSLQKLEIPRIVVDKTCKAKEETCNAWVWKLEKVMGRDDELEVLFRVQR